MNLKLIGALNFAEKLNSTNAVTESGAEFLKNYKAYLYQNEVTYGLVNGFIKEASKFSFDTGMMSILESVLKYVNENKISWKLASACESIANTKTAYNYIARLGASQVDNLLAMNEAEVVQYIKAGALKNLQYIPEFRAITKEVYGSNIVAEKVTPEYTLTNPLSYVLLEGHDTIFQVLGKTYKISDGTIKEHVCEDEKFNAINSLLPNFVAVDENLKYTWKVGMGSAPYEFTVSENYITLKKGNLEETFESGAKLCEYADTFARALTMNEKYGFLNICANISKVFEGMSNIAEVDYAKVLRSNNGSVCAIIEAADNVNMTVFKSYNCGPSCTNYEFMNEALADVKKVSGIDLKSVYETRLNEDAKKADPESYNSIQEQLQAAKDAKIELRRQKIEMLAEQFKNDPTRIAILNSVAKELAILEG